MDLIKGDKSLLKLSLSKQLHDLLNHLLIFLMTCFMGFAAHAEHLVIGVERLQYLPFYTFNGDQYQGYARELFDQFASEQHHTIEYKILPVARLFHDFVKGNVDFKFPDNPKWKSTDKQNLKLLYSKPIIAYTDGVMVTEDKQHATIAQFKTLATMRGFTPWIIQNDILEQQIKVIETNSISGLLRMVQLQRVDGCFINIDVANYILEHQLNSKQSLVLSQQLPHDRNHYFLSTISKPHILDEFNHWLETNPEFLRRLNRKWGI